MNAPHLHLILNHVPTIGSAIALGLLMVALFRKSQELTRVALEVFCVIALLTLPAFLSGVASQEALAKMPEANVSIEAITKHYDAAVVAFAFVLFTGAVAWLGLWQYRRVSRTSAINVGLVVVLSVIALAMSAGTATMGGEIRHPEMMNPGAEPTAGPSWISAAAIQGLVTDHTWLWPSLEALHFIGLWLLFGVVLIVNLRMLGMMKAASFPSLHRMLPWGLLGLSINVISGMMWVIATPEQYMTNVSFFWKMGLLLLAGFQLLYLTTFDEPWNVGPGDEAPFKTKAVAASGILLWVCVMYFGRMLPFLGNAF